MIYSLISTCILHQKSCIDFSRNLNIDCSSSPSELPARFPTGIFLYVPIYFYRHFTSSPYKYSSENFLRESPRDFPSQPSEIPLRDFSKEFSSDSSKNPSLIFSPIFYSKLNIPPSVLQVITLSISLALPLASFKHSSRNLFARKFLIFREYYLPYFFRNCFKNNAKIIIPGNPQLILKSSIKFSIFKTIF